MVALYTSAHMLDAPLPNPPRCGAEALLWRPRRLVAFPSAGGELRHGVTCLRHTKVDVDLTN